MYHTAYIHDFGIRILSNIMQNREHRPTRVTIIAILTIHTVINIWNCSSCPGIYFQVILQALRKLEPQLFLAIIYFAVAGGVLLAIGIGYIAMFYGLLKGKGWAWTITTILLIIGIAMQIISTYVIMTFLLFEILSMSCIQIWIVSPTSANKFSN